MPKGKKNRTAPKVIPHPRYGSAFIPSAHNVTEQEVRDSFWGYKCARIFAKSAIPADIEKQNFTTFPRGYYVDILKSCRGCKHKFIFFALEQKHWYEELRFYVDADCVRCTNCRSAERETTMRFQRFSNTIGVDRPTDEILETLVDDALYLWHREMYRNENGLRRLKNLANKQMPGSRFTVEINKLVELIEIESESAE